MRNIDQHRVRTNGHVACFIDDLITMNDNKKFRPFQGNLSSRIRVKERKC